MFVPDDVDTPGGRPAELVEPARVTVDGSFQVLHWPDLDLPIGTLVAMRVPFATSVGRSFLANGWQSWSAPTVRVFGNAEAPPPPYGACRRHGLRLENSGDSSNDILVTADGVVGLTSGGGLIVRDPEGESVYVVRRHVGGPHPPVLVARGDGPALADELASKCAGRIPEQLPVGWSTWEAYGQEIDAALITESLDHLRGLASRGLCDLAMIDDGYQQAIGDWHAHRDKFPAGLAALAGQIRDAGLRAGLWMSPLLVSPDSDLARRRPEWIARRADGSPVVSADVWHWGRPVHPLDVTRADVRDYLSELAAARTAEGFDLFKLDFLYAAADAADAALDRLQAGQRLAGDLLGTDTVTAAALAAIRAGVGDEVLLLGCGAPLWPSIGQVDLMRIGPDVTRVYWPREEPNSDPLMGAGMGNGERSAKLRAFLHGRLWANDPDAVLLSSRGELTERQRLAFGRRVAGSGQFLVVSDSFRDLTPRNLTQWEGLAALQRQAPLKRAARTLAPYLGPIEARPAPTPVRTPLLQPPRVGPKPRV